MLILGDTNSGISAIVARRLGIPVYHMEAGNRCYDDRVPEEVNRRVIDHSSTVLLPYTNRSRENLLAEGIAGSRIYVTGNPIKQVIDSCSRRRSPPAPLWEELALDHGRFFLVTLHRAENVDIESRLRSFLNALGLLHEEFGFPVVCSLHPRTRSKIETFWRSISSKHAGLSSFLDPLGFFDFVQLEQSAFCLLSDSPERCRRKGLYFRLVPNVTMRDVTERPVRRRRMRVEYPFGRGAVPDDIPLNAPCSNGDGAGRCRWKAPDEYLAPAVSETVCRIVLGYRMADPSEIQWRQSFNRR